MELPSFTIDLAAGGFLLFSAVTAYFSGFLREFLRLVDIAFAVVGGLLIYRFVTPFVIEMGYLTEGDTLHTLGALIASGVIGLVIGVLVTGLISNMLLDMHDSFLNKGLGLAFGFVRGLLILAIVYIGYEAIAIGRDDGAQTACPRVLAEGETVETWTDRLQTAHSAQLYCPAADAIKSFAPDSWDETPASARCLLAPIVLLFDREASIDEMCALSDLELPAIDLDGLEDSNAGGRPGGGIGLPATDGRSQ